MAKIGRPVKHNLILYFAYCIGLTLIGLLMAIGWRDFFAASRASTARGKTSFNSAHGWTQMDTDSCKPNAGKIKE